MTRVIGLLLLASAWAVVLIGLRYEHLSIPFPGKPVPLAYLGVPLLGGALFLLVRDMDRRPRGD